MWRVEIVSPSLMGERLPAWDDLAKNAAEANPFYESWLLQPAFKFLPKEGELHCLLISKVTKDENGSSPLLCGFFPLERKRHFRGFPCKSLSLWEHGHCFLGSPLIRRGYERECLSVFLEWLRSDGLGCSLLEFPHLWGDGAIFPVLFEMVTEGNNGYLCGGTYTRAFLRREEDGETYLQRSLSSNRRRDFARKRRKLEERGKVEFRSPQTEEELTEWCNDFIRIELAGWKGKAGTALGNSESQVEFFHEVMLRAFRDDRLLLRTLYVDGVPVALRCSLISGDGSFFMKPTYDESWSAYSPGVLLEFETVRQLHDHPTLQWMDSCTSPDNELLNWLWRDQRPIRHIVVGTGSRKSEIIMSTLPFFRWVKRRFHGKGLKVAASKSSSNGTGGARSTPSSVSTPLS